MASGAVVSGLDRLVQAVEAAEAAAKSAHANKPRIVSGGFMCPHPVCGRVFSKRYNQQAHMRLHDGTKPFSCTLCGKAFMWKSSLKSHAKMHAKLSAKGVSTKGVRAKSQKKSVSKRNSTKGRVMGVNKVQSIQAEVVRKQGGSESPVSISRVDHDAATVLATFR